jgi:hypothetical protein
MGGIQLEVRADMIIHEGNGVPGISAAATWAWIDPVAPEEDPVRAACWAGTVPGVIPPELELPDPFATLIRYFYCGYCANGFYGLE